MEELKELLEKHLMMFSPDQYLPKYITTPQDIYANRFFLKRLRNTEHALDYLLDILIETVKAGKRFRTLDCLKVIRAIVLTKDNTPSNRTIKKLFYLHKEFAFHKNSEVRRCINIFIKDKQLSDEAIQWLISNYKRSEHLTNRLLRYPIRHSLIISWAQNIYQHELKDREAEVIALLIDDDLPPFINQNNLNTIMWAIYYARITDETKQKLLMKYCSITNIDQLLEICKRLNYSTVIKFALTKIRE